MQAQQADAVPIPALGPRPPGRRGLTYREIGARLGLNVEAVRTRVRRAGWRTQPGNDGRARVLVPDRAFVEPIVQGLDRVNDEVNRTGDLSGLVALLTAAEARISRLEKQVEAERDRVNEARSEVDRLRGEVTDLTARADRAEQALTLADAARQDAVQATETLRRAEPPTGRRGGLWHGSGRHGGVNESQSGSSKERCAAGSQCHGLGQWSKCRTKLSGHLRCHVIAASARASGGRSRYP